MTAVIISKFIRGIFLIENRDYAENKISFKIVQYTQELQDHISQDLQMHKHLLKLIMQ